MLGRVRDAAGPADLVRRSVRSGGLEGDGEPPPSTRGVVVSGPGLPSVTGLSRVGGSSGLGPNARAMGGATNPRRFLAAASAFAASARCGYRWRYSSGGNGLSMSAVRWSSSSMLRSLLASSSSGLSSKFFCACGAHIDKPRTA